MTGVQTCALPISAYTTQVPLGAARPFAVLAGAAVTGNATTVINGDVGHGTAITLTGTVNGTTYGPTFWNRGPLKPVNFIQGFALGFALVLIGWLLLLGLRRSV